MPMQSKKILTLVSVVGFVAAPLLWSLGQDLPNAPSALVGEKVEHVPPAVVPAAASFVVAPGADEAGQRIPAPGSPTDAVRSATKHSAENADFRADAALGMCRAKRACEDIGLNWPTKEPSTATQMAVAEAYRRHMKTNRDMDEVRHPIVQRIVAAKVAAGETEMIKSARNVPESLSAEDRKLWIQSAKMQRGPASVGQTVVVQSSPTGDVLIRVDADSDVRLAAMTAAIHEERVRFAHEVVLLITNQ